MRVLLVTGSYPPDVCGTAGYTAKLQDALQQIGVDAQIFYRKRWGLMNVPSLLREMNYLKPDLIHIQYPTTGYGWKLGPQALGSARSLIVTLHEASHAHLLRQLSLYPFLMRGRHFLFTNQYEQKHVERLAPWITGKNTIVPIGCNIPPASRRPKLPNTITCFSIIRPEKGLEDVIQMAALLHHQNSSVRVRIVGAVMPRWISYYEKLRSESKELPIDWLTGLDEDALSERLAEASLVYMPFPDGASERRSSLIAMWMNHSCVMTTIGVQTPESMRSCIVETASPKAAATRAIQLLADPASVEEIATRGLLYAKRFSWESISLQHRKIYEQSLQ